MSRERRRKCRHCKGLFRPDPRNRRHQRFCSKPDCRRASKAQSQRQWLTKPANRNYFRGPEHLERVRAWRAAHPGYGRAPSPQDAPLQELSLTQPIELTEKITPLTSDPLQELSDAQPLVLLGLIAHLTGIALQEDIAQVARGFQQLARDVLNSGATHGDQTTPAPRAPPAPPPALLLDRPPPGA